MRQAIKNTRGKTSADEPVPYAEQAEVERLRTRLRDVLFAPYVGGPVVQFSITAACVELGHPQRAADKPCVCGTRGGDAEANSS